MKNLESFFKNSLVFSALGLSSCSKFAEQPSLTGIVKSEFGTLIDDTVQINVNEKSYGFVIVDDVGKNYSIQVREDYSKPLLALKEAIEQGDRVKITYSGLTNISSDGIGTTQSSSVCVIEKKYR